MMPPSEGRGRRCVRHGLAAGPDGWCALCRSESLPPPKRWSSRLMISVLGVVLLACAALLAYRALTSVTTAVEAEPVVAGAATSLPSAPDSQPLEAEAKGLEQAGPVTGESFAFDQPIPPPAAPALEAAPAPATSATAAPVPSAPAKPAPSEAVVRAALSATPIVMYATSWCSVCRKARQFLSGNGLNYQEIDADKTPGAWDKIEQLAGRRAVPVIIVDGVVSQGLDPDAVLKAVAQSMERRLGFKGIQFRSANKG